MADPDELVAAWRAHVVATGGTVLADWDEVGNEEVVSAVVSGTDPLPAFETAVRARYDTGYTFTECLEDLRALVAVLPAGLADRVDPLEGAAVIGRVFIDDTPEGSAEALTGLPDGAYLLERLREAYRRRVAVSVAVVAVVDPGEPFAAMLRRLEAAALLQTRFRDAVAVVELGRCCFAVVREGGPAGRHPGPATVSALAARGVAATWRDVDLPPEARAVGPAMDEAARFARLGHVRYRP